MSSADKQVAEILEVVPWEFQRAAKVLAKGLEGREYLVGDSFSFADLLAVHTLVWARAFKVPHGSEALNDYEQRICSRPALVRARERES